MLALVAAALTGWFLFRTIWGFELRTVGANPDAARYSGMSVGKTFVLAMFLSGCLAGLAGVVQGLGITHNIALGFKQGTVLMPSLLPCWARAIRQVWWLPACYLVDCALERPACSRWLVSPPRSCRLSRRWSSSLSPHRLSSALSIISASHGKKMWRLAFSHAVGARSEGVGTGTWRVATK